MSTEYNFSEASEYGADLDYEDYLQYVSNLDKGKDIDLDKPLIEYAVSYTHLTLPTNDQV